MMQTQFRSSISPRELNRLLDDDSPGELVDVRTPSEFLEAHVPGAKLVPLDELDTSAFLRQRDTAKPVYVLCQSGGRARKAIEKLRRAGFQQCVLVEGGTQAWIEAGLPVHRQPGGALPLMRQAQIVAGLLSATGAGLALAIQPVYAFIPLITGCGLLLAGLTGWCGMALVLAKMPWNRSTVSNTNSCCGAKDKL